MFDMANVGSRISRLRKEANMTQMELADKMNISFQAVSNWERGNSMPDIAKLPELAQLFGVTVDELLGKEAKLVESAAKGCITEYLQAETVTVEDLEEAAPLLKPDQVDLIFSSIPEGSLEDVIGLLPFLGRDIADSLLEKARILGDEEALRRIVCFAGQDAVDETARKMLEEGQNLRPIAYRIQKEVCDDIAALLYARSGISSLTQQGLLPFASKDCLAQIASAAYEKGGLQEILPIAPFLDKACLKQLAQRAIEKNGLGAIRPIVPFLDEGLLAEFVRKAYL